MEATTKSKGSDEMRLINSEDVKALINGLDSLPFEEEVDELIDIIPTAFDVEKVVEQLEEEKMWYETHGVNMDMKKGIIGATCKAINIVKAGGIDGIRT